MYEGGSIYYSGDFSKNTGAFRMMSQETGETIQAIIEQAIEIYRRNIF